MHIKFKGTMRRAGNSFVVTVPRAYIDNDLVPEDKELDFSVEVPE